ncbi:MAG: bifunctional 5,10-methylenetetrahydrofolate dehydrogenase/5,10-methenyltetrahydrofolate cyclohydrolase [Candidatus Falkowbacteria bacterium]
MTKIINGKIIADKIKDEIVKEIAKLKDHPNLAIILVGEKSDSQLYVLLKEKEGKKCGIDTNLYKFNEDTSENKLLKCIEFLNNDAKIDGILLQLPLPEKFNTDKIVNAIDVKKDVDGFHSENLKKIQSVLPRFTPPLQEAGRAKEGVRGRYTTPPLAGVILEILKDIKCDLQDKQIAMLAHSDIFMQGVGNILQQYGAKILPCNYDQNSETKLQGCAKEADIIITAVGKKHYLNSAYIKKGVIIIDIGIIKDGADTFGDVDFKDVKNIAGFITPVPGGVGPITIACAFRNVLQLYKAKK